MQSRRLHGKLYYMDYKYKAIIIILCNIYFTSIITIMIIRLPLHEDFKTSGQ